MKSKILIMVTLLMMLTSCNSSDLESDSESNLESNLESTLDSESAFAQYEEATAFVEGIKTIEMEMKLNVLATFADEEQIMPMSSLIKLNASDEANIEYSTTMTMPLDDGEMVTENFYKDGYMYSNLYGSKYKFPVTPEEVAEQIVISRPITFEEADIKEKSVTDSGEGKEIKFLLDKNPMTTRMEALTESLREQLSMLGDIEFSYSDMSITLITDKDEKMKTLVFEFTMNFTTEDEEGSAVFTTTNEIISTENIVIEYPTDLDSYIDISLLEEELENESYIEDEEYDEELESE